jgi:cell division protein FtsN
MHLAAMNRELQRGTPLPQMIAAAGEPVEQGPRAASLAETPVAAVQVSNDSLQPAYGVSPEYFIQVGAFANVDNAERARFNLEGFGNVEVTPVNASMGTVYKVTLWPPSPGVAGETLTLVRAAGHPDARLIIAQN